MHLNFSKLINGQYNAYAYQYHISERNFRELGERSSGARSCYVRVWRSELEELAVNAVIPIIQDTLCCH